MAHWRWLWVVKNRRSWYWNTSNKEFTPKLVKATIYTKAQGANVGLLQAREKDFTAYLAKGTFEISELA
jgi:hypothetical protein